MRGRRAVAEGAEQSGGACVNALHWGASHRGRTSRRPAEDEERVVREDAAAPDRRLIVIAAADAGVRSARGGWTSAGRALCLATGGSLSCASSSGGYGA